MKFAGILLAASSAIAFGFMPFFAKQVYASGVDTLTLLFLRFSIAAICLSVVARQRRGKFPGLKTFFYLVIMGIFAYVGQSLCFFTAIKIAPTGLVAILLYLYPALVALVAHFVFGQKLSWVQTTAVAIAIGGCLLCVGSSGLNAFPLEGILYALAAGSLYAIYILMGSRIPNPGSSLMNGIIILGSSAIIYFFITFMNGFHFPGTLRGWGFMLLISLVSTVFSTTALLRAVELIGPVKSSTISTLEVVTTVVLGTTLLDEKLSLTQLIGGAAVLIAVFLLVHERPKPLPLE